MSGRVDAGTLLERALVAAATKAGVSITVVAARATRWASATFVGARHRLEVACEPGDGVAAWLSGLPEADLPLRGHLVADLTVVSQDHGGGRTAITIEVLTVEDA